MIFMGNGDISEYKVKKIKRKLTKCFSHLSGLQQYQNDHPVHKVMKKELIKMYDEIGVALGIYPDEDNSMI